VRELENAIEQAAALSAGKEIGASDVQIESVRAAAPGPAPTLEEAVDEAERRAIEAALARCGSDLGRVAKELAVSSTTLWRKMKRLGIEVRTAFVPE
jgi:two-component system response regulator HydG